MEVSRVYMLASDHRWQWEEWCDSAGVPRPRISEVKNLVFEAFAAARERSDDVASHGVLLLDTIYGAEAVRRARAAGFPEWPPVAKDEQMRKLLELQAWCRAQNTVLLIEIVIMRKDEDEHEFEERGRPRLLASLIRESYDRGLVPHIWKIEGTGSAEGAAEIDDAIR